MLKLLLHQVFDQELIVFQCAADYAERASAYHVVAGVPSIAPAAYIWAGANATGAGATAGRKLMQTTQAAATHAARVADAPLSAAALAPYLAPGDSPAPLRPVQHESAACQGSRHSS